MIEFTVGDLVRHKITGHSGVVSTVYTRKKKRFEREVDFWVKDFYGNWDWVNQPCHVNELEPLQKTPNKIGNFVKIYLLPRARIFYSNCPSSGVYYGCVFDIDEEHLYLKSFSGDIQGNIYYGTMNRFLKDDIEVTKISYDTQYNH